MQLQQDHLDFCNVCQPPSLQYTKINCFDLWFAYIQFIISDHKICLH